MRTVFILLASLLISSTVHAFDIQKVSDTVYAIVGEKQQRSATNLANNATFGVVITADGVVLVDPGGSWKGAQALHKTIKTLTDQPVKIVINTGGQDHRWLGNGYWKEQDAQIIASSAAVEDHKERGSMQLTGLSNFLGKELEKTEPVYADLTFEEQHNFSLGDVSFEITHAGAAHTPGDSFVWLPDQKIVFSGDIIYVERLLGVGSMSNAKSWISVFEKLAELQPEKIIPGHGHVTDLKTATAQTYDYLVNLRTQMRNHIDEGKDILSLKEIDQSAFSHLEQFSALAGRNAQQVFTEMEWED